jgi:hypothetical protein
MGKDCVTVMVDLGARTPTTGVTRVVLPVPARGTVWGELAALVEVKVSVALRVPRTDGLKVSWMLQLAPAASVDAQLLVWLKSPAFVPVMVMVSGFSASAPELRMPSCLVYGVPTGTGPKSKLPETADGFDGGREGCGEDGIRGDGDALDAVDSVAVQFGLECIADLRRGAAEADEGAAGGDPVNVQALGGEPVGNGCDLAGGGTEALAYLCGCEPVVIVRRSGVLLVDQELLKGCFLLRRTGEDEGDVVEGAIGR